MMHICNAPTSCDIHYHSHDIFSTQSKETKILVTDIAFRSKLIQIFLMIRMLIGLGVGVSFVLSRILPLLTFLAFMISPFLHFQEVNDLLISMILFGKNSVRML